MPENREQYNAYMAAYMKSWYDRRRLQAVTQLGGCCVQCGSTDNLQFDHIDPKTKSMTIAKMWTASKVRFQAELEKCQLPCHNLKTLSELGFKQAKGNHGTISTYRYCKCDACKEAHHQYYLEWKQRQASLVQSGRMTGSYPVRSRVQIPGGARREYHT